MTLQLAKDIISDLREILKQVRSTENKLRKEQEELENTIERALGKIVKVQYSTFKLCHIPNRLMQCRGHLSLVHVIFEALK